MDFISENLHSYCVSNSTAEPELLKELRRQTFLKIPQPRMLSGPLQGRFLAMLSLLVQPKRILEIGTYTGYSAICLAEGLPQDGLLITLEKNDEISWLSNQYFKLAGIDKKVKQYLGNALEIIPRINEKFDLIFIDADKHNYLNYYHLAIDKLNKGGLIICDNTLWSGKVLLPAEPKDEDTKVLQELNNFLANDNRVSAVLLPLRDGLLLARKN